MAEKTATKIIAENRKARHDYFVEETYEAGIELFGTEVKSLRAGGVNLKDSYCEIDEGEMFALGVHISPYEQGNIFNREPEEASSSQARDHEAHGTSLPRGIYPRSALALLQGLVRQVRHRTL